MLSTPWQLGTNLTTYQHPRNSIYSQERSILTSALIELLYKRDTTDAYHNQILNLHYRISIEKLDNLCDKPSWRQPDQDQKLSTDP